jgi:serine/threonine protein kinase
MISETLREVTTSLDDGQYRVVSTLKEGRLYLAEKAGKRFVLKTAEGAKGLDLLKREYEIALRLQHPFIASAIGWEETTPVGPAIVIEYIRGRSLAKYLQEKPSLEARKRVFGQLLEAVGAIHRQSIIHNDIKPENILITETDNDVKLIDFGFADGDAHILDKGLGGTRQYASPELLAHQETDARSDIYSIGCLMRDLFPGRYCRISRKCCRTNPEKRYRNIDELKGAWGHQQRTLWIVFFLLIAALAIGAYYILNIHKQSEPAIPDINDIPETVQVESNEAEALEPEVQSSPVTRKSNPSSSGAVATPEPLAPPESTTALSMAEAKLRQAWEDSFNQVCKEMDQAGYREFLPIHVDYGTYEIDPVMRQVSSGLSADEIQALTSLNEALDMDYSQRLYAKYGSLPSLYDKSIDLPEDELKYYRNLASNFKKFSPYSKKDIK